MFTKIVAEITTEFFIIRLDRGVKNLVYCYIVVQAGSGFNIDTNTALYSTVAAEAAAEVVAEIAAEIAVEVFTEVITEIFII